MIALLLMLTTTRQDTVPMQEIMLPAAPGPLSNPLKGFAPWSTEGTRLNTTASMAYVDASWKDLEPAKGVYAFDQWESKSWNTPLAKGKPLVIRAYADYPGRPSGVPDWILNSGVGLKPYSDYGGGNSPDYRNLTFQREMLALIKNLGARYDKNPRIAYIELGLLGFWGEWHTYPHTELFASDSFQQKVVEAYHSAFPDKPLMARNPSYASCRNNWIGFHDDMIPDDTSGPEAWKFLPSMASAGLTNNWKVAPVGGEMVPGAAVKYLGENWDDLMTAVKHAHLTWIGPYCPPMEATPTPGFLERQKTLERTLGYQFRLAKFKGPVKLNAGDMANLTLSGVNEGVAPFYAPWVLEFVLLDSANAVVETEPSTIDIRSWAPGEFTASVGFRVNAKPGLYRVGVGIVDPSTAKPAVAFANRLSTVSGFAVVGSINILGKN